MKPLSLRLAPVFAASLLLVACGGGDDGGGVHFVDSGTGGGGDGDGGGCPIADSLTGLDPLPSAMAFDTAQPPLNDQDPPDPAVRYLSVGTNFSDTNLLFVEMWDGYGAFSGGTYNDGNFPKTITLQGDDTTLVGCGMCVYVLANAQVDANNNLTFDKAYIATGGTVTITSAGARANDKVTGQYTGSLSNVTFGEIDESTDDGSALSGGCTSGVATATWDVNIQDGDQ